jgi:hypothetical protein
MATKVGSNTGAPDAPRTVADLTAERDRLHTERGRLLQRATGEVSTATTRRVTRVVLTQAGTPTSVVVDEPVTATEYVSAGERAKAKRELGEVEAALGRLEEALEVAQAEAQGAARARR